MLLILSSEYVGGELRAEFGNIPPTFLPVGNRRLFELQLRTCAADYDVIVMTLPADFELDEVDAAFLREHHVQLQHLPRGLSIAEVVLTALVQFGVSRRVDVLFGDTLIQDRLPPHSDWIVVGRTADYYVWQQDNATADADDLVWSGMFSFSHGRSLRDALVTAGDFPGAVRNYEARMGMLKRVQASAWLDFGHLHTYFASKQKITTQRFFNSLLISEGAVVKSSLDHRKMAQEANWYEQAPPHMRKYLPAYLGTRADMQGDGSRGPTELGEAAYAIEYLPLPTLSELYSFGRLPAKVWNNIFSACDEFLHSARRASGQALDEASEVRERYEKKTLERIARFREQTGISLDEPWTLNGMPVRSLQDIAADCIAQVRESGHFESTLVHGDLCFSNILFDYRLSRIKVIDPRGFAQNDPAAGRGDIRYEVGKLAHSVIGRYDLILAGRYHVRRLEHALEFTVFDGYPQGLDALFLERTFLGRTPEQWDCYPVMVLLFLSMLPLHSDDEHRQWALLANAMRLYLEWRRR